MRDINLLKIRPSIPTITELNAASDWELFQNRTLRPILKLQNDLLLAIFQQYIQKRKGTFYQLSLDKQLAYIEQNIRKDQKFKNRLIGAIVGHFSLEEFQKYSQSEGELSRRLITMLIERLQSQVGVLQPKKLE